MLRKILAIAIVAFFVIGTLSAMAGEQGKCCDKNPLQGVYNWFGGLGKACGAKSTSTCCCKACGTQCCSSCNTDCGGKCCSACKAKK